MAAAFVAAAQAGDSQSVAVTSLSITIPAGAAIGNVAVLTLNNSLSTNTLTTPTGWTLQSGPDANGTNSVTWVLTKTLVSGDPGASITVTYGATAARTTARMRVYSGVTETGLQLALASETTATGTPTLPSLTGVPAGAMLDASFERRRTGASGTITIPAAYTAATAANAATAYGAGVNVYGLSGYLLSSAGGSVGGEAGSAALSSVGNNYLVALPSSSGSFSGSLALSGSGTAAFTQSSMTVSAPTSVSGSGALGFSAAPAMSGSLALSGSGSAAFAGAPAVPGSLGLTGSTSLSFVQPTGGAIALAGAGSLALSGSGQLYVFSGPVIYENAPFQPFTAHWSRLVFEIAYGETVWRAADGSWQQQYAPSPEQLAGALAVYAGGRNYHLTDQQRADLIAGGYGGYITLENMS